MAHPAWMCPLVLSCSLPLQLSASSGRPRRQGRAAAADCCALPACCRCSGLNVCIQQGVVQGAGCDDKPPLGGQVRVARQRDHQQRLSPQHPCCPTPQTWLGIVGALSMLFQARPDMRLPLGPPPPPPKLRLVPAAAAGRAAAGQQPLPAGAAGAGGTHLQVLAEGQVRRRPSLPLLLRRRSIRILSPPPAACRDGAGFPCCCRSFRREA
jgi:hypothetical protein